MATLRYYQEIADELAAKNGLQYPIYVEHVREIQRIDPNTVVAGFAEWDDHHKAFTIKMIARGPESEQNSLFAHELAHILLKHIKPEAPPPLPAELSSFTPEQVDRIRTLMAAKGLLAPDVQAKHDQREREADELAEKICRAWWLTWDPAVVEHRLRT